jgi:hypothetical protein
MGFSVVVGVKVEVFDFVRLDVLREKGELGGRRWMGFIATRCGDWRFFA